MARRKPSTELKARYRKIKLPDGSTRDEHRLVMERKLGRRLTFHEVVHHKDGDRHNNDPSNLELLTRSQHGRLHGKDYAAACRSRAPKLSLDLAREIRKLLRQGSRSDDLAAQFNVSVWTIRNIRGFRAWAEPKETE